MAAKKTAKARKNAKAKAPELQARYAATLSGAAATAAESLRTARDVTAEKTKSALDTARDLTHDVRERVA